MSDLVGNPEDRFSHNEAHIAIGRELRNECIACRLCSLNLHVVDKSAHLICHVLPSLYHDIPNSKGENLSKSGILEICL